MSQSPNPPAKLKPVTQTTIPGTEVPDISQVNAESERAKQWMSRVAVSTAIMAAGAAISTSFSSGHLNKAMFEQIREADTWNQYQAKSIKHTVLESRIATITALGKEPAADDRATLERYVKEKATLENDAKEVKKASVDHLARYTQLSRASTAMQIGIALAAVALLLRKNIYWALALAAGAVGAGFLVLGFI
jgi:hypothetical protein